MTGHERTKSDRISERSQEALETHHLHRLAKIAIIDLEDLFQQYPHRYGSLYQDRLMLICLCQGAAGHFVNRDRGVKDFDVWTFFREHPERPFPYRRRAKRDFGSSRFGRHPDCESLRGRRVDLLGRSVPCEDGQDPYACVREWICGRGKSSREIAKSPVVVIHPEADSGRIIWNPEWR